MCDDLSRLVRRYDRDVNGSWSFREFLTFVQPLSQYSLKAKDLQTGIVLGGGDKSAKESADKLLLAETSSTSSLGELNQILRKKGAGKENKTDRNTVGPAFSRASNSTAAVTMNESFTRGG